LTVSPAGKESKRRFGPRHYIIIGACILLSLLLVAPIVYFWKEIQNASSYGYLGVFISDFLAGMTIFPFPSLPVTFALGGVLNPAYVALVSGLGGAIGELPVYYTGFGGKAILSKLFTKQAYHDQPNSSSDSPTPSKSKLRARWQAFYRSMVSPVGRGATLWAVFITSAILWPLSYPADLAAGILRINLVQYFLANWAGRTARGFIVAYAGHWGLNFVIKWLGG